jgi:hypothetical protein
MSDKRMYWIVRAMQALSDEEDEMNASVCIALTAASIIALDMSFESLLLDEFKYDMSLEAMEAFEAVQSADEASECSDILLQLRAHGSVEECRDGV